MPLAAGTRLTAIKKLVTALAIALASIVPLGISPAFAAPALPHSITIRFQISGGYRFSGTFSTSSSSADDACVIRRRGRGSAYAVNFHAQAFRSLQLNQNAFQLVLPSYRPAVQRYTGLAQEIDVSVGQHYFHGGLLGIRTYVDSSFRITVRVRNGGLAGTFTARHLQVQHGPTLVRLVKDRFFAAIQGSWSCSSVVRA